MLPGGAQRSHRQRSGKVRRWRCQWFVHLWVPLLEGQGAKGRATRASEAMFWDGKVADNAAAIIGEVSGVKSRYAFGAAIGLGIIDSDHTGDTCGVSHRSTRRSGLSRLVTALPPVPQFAGDIRGYIISVMPAAMLGI